MEDGGWKMEDGGLAVLCLDLNWPYANFGKNGY